VFIVPSVELIIYKRLSACVHNHVARHDVCTVVGGRRVHTAQQPHIRSTCVRHALRLWVRSTTSQGGP